MSDRPHLRYSTVASWWLSERIIGVVAGLVVQISLVRSLGVRDFGEVSYILALLAILAPISYAGAAGLVTRAINENPSSERDILQAALRWRLYAAIAACVFGIVYWGIADNANPARATLVLLAIAQIALIYQVIEFRYQATMTPSELIPWRVVATLVGAAIKITVAFSTADPFWVSLSFSADFLLQALAQNVAYFKSVGVWLRPARNPIWSPWLAARAPWLLVSAVAELIYLKIDIVMLERLVGLDDTGLYAAAAKLSEAWYLVPGILMAAWFPLIWSPSEKSEYESQEKKLQSIFDLMVVMALGVAVCMQVLGDWLIATLYGATFASAGLLLKIHIWAGVFIFMRAVLSKWLIAHDLLKYSLVSHGAGMTMNIGLNFILIPRYGAAGAAISTVISYAVSSWIILFFFPRTRPVGWMMTRALLIPLRWRDLRNYVHQLGGRQHDH